MESKNQESENPQGEDYDEEEEQLENVDSNFDMFFQQKQSPME